MNQSNRHRWNAEQWVIDRLVDAVESGDVAMKSRCGQRLLTGYEQDGWQAGWQIETAPFLSLAQLDPKSWEWDEAVVLEGEAVSQTRLDHLAAGAAMTASEVDGLRSVVAGRAFDEEFGDYWAILRLLHSNGRRRVYMAVTEWDGKTGCFLAAYSTYPEALNALRGVGFTSERDFQSRGRSGFRERFDD
ncbi:MAG: hypothetical protein OSB03_20045 [Vicinamibacterales bacterium]|nr:hypothetical protein [Vicinamibacterales bacterium]